MIDKIIKQLNIRGKLIYLSQYGSHLYGLDTPSSDIDFRGIYIPTLDDIILKKDLDEINKEIELDGHKIDIKIFSLQKFVKLCSKADTNALDLLFSCHKDYAFKDKQSHVEQYYAKPIAVMPYICSEVSKLINTDRLESPITYAFKQATKYGIKGERLKVLENILIMALQLNNLPFKCTVEDLVKEIDLDNKHLKIDELDNKGKTEKYLYVCGIQHQFNLDINTFVNRIVEKINKEYTSERTKSSKDGNDWKALSHAIRVLLEVKELLETGNIKFPLKDKDFIKDIKLGKIERKIIDEYFNKNLSDIINKVQENKLSWEYDENFWNEFILKEVKNVF